MLRLCVMPVSVRSGSTGPSYRSTRFGPNRPAADMKVNGGDDFLDQG